MTELTPKEKFLRSTDPYKTVSQAEAEFRTALVKALVLSITAPTDEDCEKASKLAISFASHLDKKAVEECKQKVKELMK
tara:strand:- start:2030 stop:2266 length:237 start_codon:yes stop_codon:yes gene_type:complete